MNCSEYDAMAFGVIIEALLNLVTDEQLQTIPWWDSDGEQPGDPPIFTELTDEAIWWLKCNLQTNGDRLHKELDRRLRNMRGAHDHRP